MAKKLPTVLLRSGEDRRVRAGHPWAFSNENLMDAETKALPPGSLEQNPARGAPDVARNGAISAAAVASRHRQTFHTTTKASRAEITIVPVTATP